MMRVLFWLVIVGAYFLLIVLICKCVSFARRNYEKLARPGGRPGWTDVTGAEAAELSEEPLQNSSEVGLREATRMAR